MEEVLNILYEFIFGNPHGVQMGFLPFLMAGISMIGGLVGSANAKSAARRRAGDAADLQRQITGLENSRQNVINPYADVKDLSGMVTNPFQNLQVATSAAEMQAEEQDISLATTLDTLRATGASAGGATALAQAASRSKANIAANIEKQEAMNSRLRAQGEQRMQQLQMSEAARVQGATAQGKAFMFNAQETRDVSKLNRLAGLQQNAEGQANQLRGQASAMQGQAWGALGSMAGELMGNANWNKYAGGDKTGAVNDAWLSNNGVKPRSEWGEILGDWQKESWVGDESYVGGGNNALG
jgi:hypothetical protein